MLLAPLDHTCAGDGGHDVIERPGILPCLWYWLTWRRVARDRASRNVFVGARASRSK
jgi:hypothetical protein